MNVHRLISPAVFFVAILFLAGCVTAPNQTKASPSEKEKLADELLAIEPPVAMFARLSDPHAAVYASAQRRERAHENFMRNVDANALDDVIRRALLRHFTEEELRALVAFCSTPEGHTCLVKSAAFASEVVPACAHEATKAFGKTAIEASCGRLLP